MLFRTVGARRKVLSLLLSLSVLNACGGTPEQTLPTMTPDEGVRAISAQEANGVEQALREDTDAKAIMEMTAELASRAEARGVSRIAYTTAIRNHGITGAAEALGLPPAEFEEFAGRFQQHMTSLIERYPALAELQQGTAVIASAPAGGAGTASAEEEPYGCKWLQYLACLVLCTQTGPLYIACALLCWCSFCENAEGNPWGVCEL